MLAMKRPRFCRRAGEQMAARPAVMMILIAILAANRARADTNLSLEPTTRVIPALAPFDPFRKGEWSADFFAAYTHPVFNDRFEFFSGTVGLSYAPIDRFTLSAEFSGDYITEPGGDGVGAGISLRSRYEVVKLQRVAIFVDLSGGAIQSDRDLPTGAIHFNFVETAGIGLMTPITSNIILMGGAHLEHISNAGLTYNPGVNGVQFYLGLTVPL
jgi:hypothetical protein